MTYTQNDNQANLAEALLNESKKPEIIEADEKNINYTIAVPAGWSIKEINAESRLNAPLRKKNRHQALTVESFVDLVNYHKTNTSTVWADCSTDSSAEQSASSPKFTAVINDYSGDPNSTSWRDFTIEFRPEFSKEFVTWKSKCNKSMSQTEFAYHIENNMQDIASADNMPSGAAMLEMAINFEAKQDARFKSAIRLQSGGVEMTFVNKDDAATIEKMAVFSRFAIGIPIFFKGIAYQINARLNYRAKEGNLMFWYELIRPDLAIDDATNLLAEKIKTGTSLPLFFGK